MRRLSLLPALAAACSLAACAEGPSKDPASEEPGAADGLTIVEPGKEDNFLSLSAQEYALTGTMRVTLEPELAGKTAEERLARARELVPFRQVVLGWFLNQYIVEKDHKAGNAGYGGFKALTKNGSWEDLALREVDELTFEMDVRQEIAGPMDLLRVLPTKLENGKRYFDLVIGKVGTDEMQRLETNNEWYRQAPWDGFDPTKVSADRQETVRLWIDAEPRSQDAWFDYERLVADGALDIGVHFGWDYHSEYHLKHSRSVYQTLVAQGFAAPVADYEALTRTSGPLTKTLKTPAGDVQVRVSLFWGKPGTETDPDTDAGGRVLEDDMRASLANRDIIVFSGHSGPFYGFALANWRKTSEGDLDDSELSSVQMPAGRYQIVLAEGCDTYAIGQGFFLNPAKPGRKDLDIITTTSFSNASTASTVTDFLDAFIATDAAGVIAAPRLSTLLEQLDSNSSWFSTMYGVHGIDDNPRRHPWAEVDALCGECGGDADCGAAGNRCVKMNGVSSCTYECSADDGCAEGFVCQGAASAGAIQAKVCVTPRATCDFDDAATPPAVRIQGAVPNPDKDLNGDGRLDATKDETVTLVNGGNRATDLTGWAIADDVGVRFTFPRGSKLEPGATVTVYGGGGQRLVAARGLGLNNDGDSVRLLDNRGAEVDRIAWRRAARGATIGH